MGCGAAPQRGSGGDYSALDVVIVYNHRMTQRTKKNLKWIYWLSSLALAITGIYVGTITVVPLYTGLAFVFVPLTFIFLRGAWRFGRMFNNEVNIAMAGVPDPRQIAISLEEELDRPPTYEEVNAVHEILTRRRNEAAATVAVGFGAAYLIGR